MSPWTCSVVESHNIHCKSSQQHSWRCPSLFGYFCSILCSQLTLCIMLFFGTSCPLLCCGEWLFGCACLFLGIPGLTLVCSRLQLGEPNRHDWSQQLERQREPCRGYGEDERLCRQARRQWCWGGVEPWYRTELPGGPCHLSSLWTQEDHPLWWGKDVWWVQMCVSCSCMFFLKGENWRRLKEEFDILGNMLMLSCWQLEETIDNTLMCVA